MDTHDHNKSENAALREEIIDSQEIYNGRIVHLKKHTVRLPDGTTSMREVISHVGAAATLVIDDEDRVLLVKQYRIAADRITLEIPAGLLDAGEAPLECARRELREETGYEPYNLESLGGVHVAPGYTSEYIHLFYTTHVTHNPLPRDDDEFVNVTWLPLDEVLEMIAVGTITEAKTVVALLRGARLRGV